MAKYHPEEHMRGRLLMDTRSDPQFNGRFWPWTKILSELPYMKLVDIDSNTVVVAEKILNSGKKPSDKKEKIGIGVFNVVDIKETEDDTA